MKDVVKVALLLATCAVVLVVIGVAYTIYKAGFDERLQMVVCVIGAGGALALTRFLQQHATSSANFSKTRA